MLNIDVAKRPFSVGDWRSVLGAVYGALPQDESDWVEWKSSLDLRSKEHLGPIVAKTIIAFANRDPVIAAQTLQGAALLIVGVEPGNVPGVARVDNEALDKNLSRYLGSDGPRWRPHWDTFHGKEILIIEVEPPEWGDPVHTFRKAYSDKGVNIHEGSVYVRKHARSVLADHADIQRLAARMGSQAAAGLDITLDLIYPTPLSRYQYGDDACARLIAAEQARMLAPLQRDRDRRAQRRSDDPFGEFVGGSSIFRAMGPSREQSEQTYELAVEKYCSAIADAWPDIARRLTMQVVGRPKFIMVNASQRNYRQMEVSVHISGEADAELFDGKKVSLAKLLPVAPRLWGSSTMDIDTALKSAFPYKNMIRSTAVSAPSTTINREGGLALTFPAVDLRPGASVVLEDSVVLLIPITRDEPVVARWTATCLNVDATATGVIPIHLDGPDFKLFEK